MATVIITGSKDRQIPGIDAGSFTAGAGDNGTKDTLILVKFKYLHSFILHRTDAATQVVYSTFQTATSAGALITMANAINSAKYQWHADGIGG